MTVLDTVYVLRYRLHRHPITPPVGSAGPPNACGGTVPAVAGAATTRSHR